MPVFTRQGQEGKLFAPLAFTKTYAMASAEILSITLVTVLMGWLIRGRIQREQDNIINRGLTRVYRQALDWVLARPKKTLAIAQVVLLSTVWPMSRIGSELVTEIGRAAGRGRAGSYVEIMVGGG